MREGYRTYADEIREQIPATAAPARDLVNLLASEGLEDEADRVGR